MAPGDLTAVGSLLLRAVAHRPSRRRHHDSCSVPACPSHHRSAGTQARTAATCWPQPAQVVLPQVLGACRPQLAYQAIQADPSVATVLPCNVVVRAVDDDTTVVEAFDPAAMVSMGGAQAADSPLATVAADARDRLTALLENLTESDKGLDGVDVKKMEKLFLALA